MDRWLSLTLGAASLLTAVSAVQADDYATFDLAYSGTSVGDSAMATGYIVLDLTAIQNPGNNSSGFVEDFALTISGASSGNGTFTLGDFDSFSLETGGGTLDFTQQLVGQATTNAPYGTTNTGSSGDFNVFTSEAGAPDGSAPFQFTTDQGAGDPLVLTSFAPEVPEPSSLALAALGGFGILGLCVRLRQA